jgi:L-threonylcarbamoyladenylate synthase
VTDVPRRDATRSDEPILHDAVDEPVLDTDGNEGYDDEAFDGAVSESHEEDHGYDGDYVDIFDDGNIYDCNDPARRSEGFAAAKAALGESGLIVMPTDTVYGVAADAFDPTAVRRLLRAKGRGRSMPVPVLIGEVSTLRALATDISYAAQAFADAFWPGAVTLICAQQPSLRWDLGDSRGTAALRVPDHEDARALLQSVGPLAVSSANTTGDPPAVTIADARRMLGAAIDVYLDAGPTPGPQPSSIIDVVSEPPRLVRSGAVSAAELREVVPSLVLPQGIE